MGWIVLPLKRRCAEPQCISYFYHCNDKICEQCNVRRKDWILAYGLRVQSTVVGTILHLQSRSRESDCWCSAHALPVAWSRTLAHKTVQHSLVFCLSQLQKTLWEHLHSHAQKCIVYVILGPAKLPINIEHHVQDIWIIFGTRFYEDDNRVQMRPKHSLICPYKWGSIYKACAWEKSLWTWNQGSETDL